jgi:hypothetical protein
LRRLAILNHLASESSFTKTRSQVLVDEYTHAGIERVKPHPGGFCRREQRQLPDDAVVDKQMATR